MAPEICTKMLKNMSEKLRAKFTATTPNCSTGKIGHFDDSFVEVFLTASKPSERSIPEAKRKEKEKKERKKKTSKIEKPKDVGHLLVQKLNLKILISAHTRAQSS